MKRFAYEVTKHPAQQFFVLGSLGLPILRMGPQFVRAALGLPTLRAGPRFHNLGACLCRARQTGQSAGSLACLCGARRQVRRTSSSTATNPICSNPCRHRSTTPPWWRPPKRPALKGSTWWGCAARVRRCSPGTGFLTRGPCPGGECGA